MLTCSHEIDMSIFLFGEVKNCKIIYIKKDLKINVDEKCLVILQHKNNIVSEIYLDFTNQNNSRKLDIVTTDRIFKWDFNKNYIQVIKKNKIENIKIKFNLDNIYEKQIRDFIISSKNKKNMETVISFKNTIETQRVINMLKRKSSIIF